MGWSFGWKTRQDMVDYLMAENRLSEGYTKIESQWVGNNHWFIYCRKADQKLKIGLDIISGGQGDWGYKGLDESMGPTQLNCPLSFLKVASAPEGYAVEWREQVRAFHAAKKSRPKPVAGMAVESNDVKYELIAPAGPRRGWIVKRSSDGARFRMPAAQLARALMDAVS